MAKNITEKMYTIINKPVITEKTTMVAEQGKVVFDVSVDATKKEIKEAFEAIYNTEVKNVNTLVRKGKAKRFKGILGKRKNTKKAYITLKDGSDIDIMSFSKTK